MSVAAAHECTPESVLAHAGKMFAFSCDTVSALLRAVAVAAAGEDIEMPCGPCLVGTAAGVVAATHMQQEIESNLAARREEPPLRVRDGGQDHDRGQVAGCPVKLN